MGVTAVRMSDILVVMNRILLKIVNNPYLLGVSMVVIELTVNVLTSIIFQKELGETNLSFWLWFIIAGYVVASVRQEPVSSSYGTKVTFTYFGIVLAIAFLSVVGKPLPGLPLLLLLGLFASIVAAVSYALFMFTQKKFAEAIQKQKSATLPETPREE